MPVDNFNCGIPWDLWGSDGIFGTMSHLMHSSCSPGSILVRTLYIESLLDLRSDLLTLGIGPLEAWITVGPCVCGHGQSALCQCSVLFTDCWLSIVSV